eukprot:1195546-Prorocentrum_minimum.AAC.2
MTVQQTWERKVTICPQLTLSCPSALESIKKMSCVYPAIFMLELSQPTSKTSFVGSHLRTRWGLACFGLLAWMKMSRIRMTKIGGAHCLLGLRVVDNSFSVWSAKDSG